jgi:flagellar biogenesis protein FliO
MIHSLTLCLWLALSADPVAPAPSVPPQEPPAPTSVKDDPTLFDHAAPSQHLAESGDAAESLGLVLVKMLLGLGVTIGVIYLSLAYVARRLQQFPALKGSVLKIVERVPLEPRRTLFLVEAAGDFLVIGAGEGPMALIAKLDSEKARAAMAEAKAAAAGAPKPFWLRLLEKRRWEK